MWKTNSFVHIYLYFFFSSSADRQRMEAIDLDTREGASVSITRTVCQTKYATLYAPQTPRQTNSPRSPLSSSVIIIGWIVAVPHAFLKSFTKKINLLFRFASLLLYGLNIPTCSTCFNLMTIASGTKLGCWKLTRFFHNNNEQ